MNPSFIGKATLEQARALLSQARNELEPRQWELLDSKLTEAEQAFERFNRVANATGKVAQVARGRKALPKLGALARPSKLLEPLPERVHCSRC